MLRLALIVGLAASAPAASRTPVILMNGFGFGCPDASSTLSASQGTFGQLAPLLQADGIEVWFFNNCAYGADIPIEKLAAALGAFITSLKSSDGTPVTQVDLVAHSMGGLIARTYLAGLQSGGAFAAPLNPRVRKLVLIATPNFGSFLAPLLQGTQTSEMSPGSAFLWNLDTWNQHQDDLRGVDALAVVGNAGYVPGGQDDGVVSVTSGSLGFARPDVRTRIVPYCHITAVGLIASVVKCAARGIADIDSPAHMTAQIVRSFLADTPDWATIGKSPSQDPVLSQFGGVYFAEQTAADQWITDFTQVSFGSTPLSNGGAAGTVFYNEFLKGTDTFQGRSASLGSLSCGPFTEPAGFYTVPRCKLSTQIFSVGPFVPGTAARTVQSGTNVNISGSGFGSRCASCTVVLNPGAVPLPVVSWSDQTITAGLPPYSGTAQIVVQAAAGADAINFVAAPPASSVAVTAIVNAASGAPGTIAPGEIVTIAGSGLGPAAGVSFSLNAAGGVDTTLAGTRVLFGGVAAPITYASANQINAIVPYEIAGQTQVTMQVSSQGNLSAGMTLAVASAAPGIFTASSAGFGQAVAANQDGTYNGSSNPAAKGSYVTLYFTGGGQTNPPGSTGSVNGLTLKWLTQDISVTVGGQAATVTFDGAAPTLVDGVLQLNLRLADNAPSGSAQPVVITVGGMSSPPAATIAVR